MLNWRFGGDELHNVTVASGPRGFSSAHLDPGRSYRKKLTTPGTYKLFCGLHPVAMTQTVKVLPKRDAAGKFGRSGERGALAPAGGRIWGCRGGCSLSPGTASPIRRPGPRNRRDAGLRA